MKKLISILAITFAVFLEGCKENSSVDEPEKPFFYVKYHGDHWATVDFNKTCTMTITNEKGQDVSYSIGSRDVVIGPVYAGFTAKMTISAPHDGGNNGSICIARNSDHLIVYEYASFANSKKAETLTYTIQESTGK